MPECTTSPWVLPTNPRNPNRKGGSSSKLTVLNKDYHINQCRSELYLSVQVIATWCQLKQVWNNCYVSWEHSGDLQIVIYWNNSAFWVKPPDLSQLTSHHLHVTILNSEEAGTFQSIHGSSLRDLEDKDSFPLLFPTHPLWHCGDIIWLIMLQLSNLQSGILPCLTGCCQRNHSVSWQKEVISAYMRSVGRALSLPSTLNCYCACSISAKAFLSVVPVIT